MSCKNLQYFFVFEFGSKTNKIIIYIFPLHVIINFSEDCQGHPDQTKCRLLVYDSLFRMLEVR